MSKRNRILNLYTLYFPQGNYEAFLETEITYLCAAFDVVNIFPLTKLNEPIRKIPTNANVHFTEVKDKDFEFPFIQIFGLILYRLLTFSKLDSLPYQSRLLKGIIAKKEILSNAIQSQVDTIHYSYWFDEWATVLGLLFKEQLISGYVTRAHGFDLYDERQDLGYHPFRHIQKHGLKKIFPVSRLGSEYLKTRIDDISIETSYLGTEDHGPGPHPGADKTRILSVARAVPLKRLDRIAEVVSQCKEPLIWTHMGSGPELDDLKKLVKEFPSHIEVEFLGEMSHERVMDLFQNQAFHLLISLSESEGLPVSMMEAMSFGVPVLSTDVGGVHEMVNGETGLLLPKTVIDEEISEIIDGWKLSSKVSEEFRSKVRAYWRDYFSANKNYPEFMEKLKKLFQ